MELNFEQLHLFLEGMKNSREQHGEENKSFEFGLNGRLTSVNGSLSYSSIKGTLEIYKNPKIVKYLGYFAFSDELVLLVKYDETANLNVVNKITEAIIGGDKVFNIPFGNITYELTNELSQGAKEEFYTTIETETIFDETVLENNYNEPIAITPLDLSKYYFLSDTNIPNYQLCTIQDNTVIPEHNKQYIDAIIILRNDGPKFKDTLAWKGNLNWDINRKISTVGIFENEHYKRVYLTDNLNPLRVINLKDRKLITREPEEFDIIQKAAMLQPIIKEIKDSGSLKAMSVQYAYRLITENGQVTSFSPYSSLVFILRDDNDYDFSGGGVSEITSKAVLIDCPVTSLNYKEIQAIAIEYEADTIPSAIRNLGRKPVNSIVEFIHTGNESEFTESLTLEDITETKASWTYCNDLTIKNNKLIVGGLRNTPLSLQEKYIEDLFLFKGWDSNGNTHNTLINPQPDVYRYFDPTFTEKSVLIKKQLYTRFLFFGNATLFLKNKLNPSSFIQISFVNSKDQYSDYFQEISDWLTDPLLDLSNFSNLEITKTNNGLLFSRIDENILTDLNDYYFESSITQTIIDVENQYELLDSPINTDKIVYGAQSIGFNQGTGVRVSFEEKIEPILNKQQEVYNGGVLLNLETPSLNKTFVKDEIYRLSIQFFKNGAPKFAIVLGDVKTPAIGDIQRYIGYDDTFIYSNDFYVNQSSQNNQLMLHRLEMRVEVRIPCEYRNTVDSYQIQYVERTENNRTVIAQGISAPLTRMTAWMYPSLSPSSFAPDVYDRWTLPHNGGPLYSVNGLKTYSLEGENYNYSIQKGSEWFNASNVIPKLSAKRIVSHRALFYFDSPDLIYGRISDQYITNAKCHVIGRVNTDHTKHLITSRTSASTEENTTHPLYNIGGDHAENETYSTNSYSRKIPFKYLSGEKTIRPYFVNISIFSEFSLRNQIHEIDKHSGILNKGTLLPPGVLGSSFGASNKALVLFAPDAFNSGWFLSGVSVVDQYINETGQSSQYSEGYNTLFIRTKDDLFTNEFVGETYTNPIKSKPHTEDGVRMLFDVDNINISSPIKYNPMTDSHAIINLKANNIDSIYGGRSKYAYAQNIFIPLSKVVPVLTGINNQAQIFNVQGDFYVSLFLRTKNDYSEGLIIPEVANPKMRQDDDGHNSIRDYVRGGAWAYGVVLETEVEVRLTDDYRFFRGKDNADFTIPLKEIINSAYLKKDNLRIYSPMPYNFKDDPLRTSTLAASKTKLNGDYFDAWTQFLINEFYELEKTKGIITNITTWKDEIFVIQEHESNQVNIDGKDFVTTQSGESVAVKKGDGRTFTNHKKLSDFGTSIRRALAEGEMGFSFFDEYNSAFVKFGESISLKQEVQHKLQELFQEDPIVDTEGYYDVENKETNIRIRTQKGNAYLLSYNEILQVFNGWLAYDNDIYIVYNQRVFAPLAIQETITIEEPEIISEVNLLYQIGTYFEYQIEATNNPISYNATGLPEGLFVNRLSGIIYGAIDIPGIYTFEAYAENEVYLGQITITVEAVLPELNSTISTLSEVIGTLHFQGGLSGNSNGSSQLNALINGRLFAQGSSSGSSQPTSSLIQPFSMNSYTGAFGQTSDNNLLIYGDFSSPDAQIVKVDTCGNLDTTFAANITGVGGNYVFSATRIKQAFDGSIYLTGLFTSVNGVNKNYFCKLTKDGVVDNTFNIGTGFQWFTTDVFVDFDNSVYVSGIYTAYKGVARNQLVKLDQTGAVISAFQNRNFGTTVVQIIEANNSQIWVHGYFSGNIRLINKSDGSLDPNFIYGTGFNNAGNDKPMTAIIDSDKLVLVSMYGFTTWNGNSISRNIVRLNRDGSVDSSFLSGSGFTSGGAYAIIKDGDKYVLLTEYNSVYNGINIPYLVRLNNDGTIDNTFNFIHQIGTGTYNNGFVKIGDYYYLTDAISATEVRILKVAMDGSAEVLMPKSSCELPIGTNLRGTSRGKTTTTSPISSKSLISATEYSGTTISANLTEQTALPFILEFTTTTSNQSVTLPFTNNGTFDATVNWDDGSGDMPITTWDSVNRIHTFANPGVYQVKLWGAVGGFSFENVTISKDLCTDIIHWGDTTFEYLVGAFRGTKIKTTGNGSIKTNSTSLSNGFYLCTSLTTIKADTFKDSVSITNFSYLFYGCNLVTSLPVDLFRYNVNVTLMNAALSSMTGLTSIPANLFRYNLLVTNFDYIFYNCTSLTSLPTDLFQYNTNVTFFTQSFWGCIGLTSLPIDLFRYNVNVDALGFVQCFMGCTGLTSLPTDLFRYNLSATSFQQTFDGCSGLLSVPTGLFQYNTNASTFRQTFSNCTSLTTIPSGFFDNNINTTSFYMTFIGCSNLSTVPVNLFRLNVNVTTFYQTFLGCVKLQVNRNIFYADGEQSTRFAGKSIIFIETFMRNTFTGTQGEAPDLWNCTFGTINSTRCFANGGNSATSLSNYASIPTVWKT